MARRRYQTGHLFVRGKRRKVWVGQWREDVIQDGRLRRVRRKEVLGTVAELPTRKLAQRELDLRLAVVNDPCYRARPAATFEEFARRWEATVVPQHKPSTQINLRSHLRRYLVPAFGPLALRDLNPETVQRFAASLRAAPKTIRNIFATLRMLWHSARTWRYVAYDALDGIILPRATPARQHFFTPEQVVSILSAADEPQRTFYWLLAETGMRAGEACGLAADALDLQRGQIFVRQAAWRGRLQAPKTPNSIRRFQISARLARHLRAYIESCPPNGGGLLFASRGGNAWDANLVQKRKLRPLLRRLGIEAGGLHAFRHTNASLMDRLGVPLTVRQARLGHADPRMTMRYSHVLGEDDRAAAENIAAFLAPIGPTLEKPESACSANSGPVN